MTDKALLKRALDALTAARDSVSNELSGIINHPSNARVIECVTDDLAKADASIAELRAALAEPVAPAEPTRKPGWNGPMIQDPASVGDKPATSEPEPVADMWTDEEGFAWCTLRSGAVAPMHGRAPLYTTPPDVQRLMHDVCAMAEQSVLPDGDEVPVSVALWAEEWAQRFSAKVPT